MNNLVMALFTLFWAQASEWNMPYSGLLEERKASLDWSAINTDDWNSLSKWKDRQEKANHDRGDGVILKKYGKEEMVGRILHCVGPCTIYRGNQHFSGQFKTAIFEGDDLQTQEDSYVWVFLLDGSLIRFSPHTSVSFKEIDFARNEVFFNLRLNSGNIQWLHRQAMPPKYTNDRETDTLFLPLPVPNSNVGAGPESSSFSEPFINYYWDQTARKNQYQILSDLWKKNSNEFSSTSIVFLATAVGSLLAENANFEAIGLLGGELFFQKRGEDSKLKMFLHSSQEKNSSDIQDNGWYRVDAKGQELTSYEAGNLFQINQFLISNIPSILLAREHLMRRYSTNFLNKRKNFLSFAKSTGHRLWMNRSEPNSDLGQRIDFLIDATRNAELRSLEAMQQVRMRIENRGEFFPEMTFGRHFFNKALVNFYRKGESLRP